MEPSNIREVPSMYRLFRVTLPCTRGEQKNFYYPCAHLPPEPYHSPVNTAHLRLCSHMPYLRPKPAVPPAAVRYSVCFSDSGGFKTRRRCTAEASTRNRCPGGMNTVTVGNP